MQKNILLTTFIFFFSIAVVAPFFANAQLNLWEPKTDAQKEDLNKFATNAGFRTEEVTKDTAYALVGQLINTFLGLLGVVFLLLIVYGGFKWMNAQGAEEDVKKAKDTITQAVIGLVIIMAAYAISNFVIGNIQKKTLKTTDSFSTHFV